MERNAQKNSLVNLLTLLVMAVAGYAVARYSRSLTGLMSVIFMGMGALVSAMGWFQMRLAERERLEKLEFQELTKSAASSTLFTSGETEVFPAQRSREHFEKFVVPGFSGILFVPQAGVSLLLLRWFLRYNPGPILQPLVCLGLFG